MYVWMSQWFDRNASFEPITYDIKYKMFSFVAIFVEHEITFLLFKTCDQLNTTSTNGKCPPVCCNTDFCNSHCGSGQVVTSPRTTQMTTARPYSQLIGTSSTYEGCSNMNASSFITFFTYMLRQHVIPSSKELFVAFKMAPNIKKRSLYFSSYRPLYKGHSCILKLFWSKLHARFGTCADTVSYLCKF